LGLLYPKVRNNIGGDIPVDVPPPNQNIGGCVPGIPGGVDASGRREGETCGAVVSQLLAAGVINDTT